MKTTLDLPEELVRKMKLRAAQEGKKLKEVATEVVRLGLAVQPAAGGAATGRRVKLPLIVCERAAPDGELTPDRIASVLAGQEAEWSNEAAGR